MDCDDDDLPLVPTAVLLNETHFTPYIDLTFMCVVFANLICFSILIKKD